MGRSGLVGMVSILLLLAAAILVMVATKPGTELVERVLGAPTDTSQIAIPPALRATTPSGSAQQADRAIQDIHTGDQLMRDAIGGTSPAPIGR